MQKPCKTQPSEMDGCHVGICHDPNQSLCQGRAAPPPFLRNPKHLRKDVAGTRASTCAFKTATGPPHIHRQLSIPSPGTEIQNKISNKSPSIHSCSTSFFDKQKGNKAYNQHAQQSSDMICQHQWRFKAFKAQTSSKKESKVVGAHHIRSHDMSLCL